MNKKHWLAFFFSFIMIPSVFADFSDVPETSSSYQAVSALEGHGVIEGYADGTFSLDQLVNRAEFLKMTLLLNDDYNSQLELPTEPCFDDLKAGDWFIPHVCWAKEKEMISGYPDGLFHPEKPINVAEAAKIINNGQAYYGSPGHWANGYLLQMMDKVLPDSIESADQLLTRAETAEILWRSKLASWQDLKDKTARILAWDGSQFLPLDYIGKVQMYVLEYYYGRHNGKVYGLSPRPDDPNFSFTEISEANAESFQIYHDSNGDFGYSIAGDKAHLFQLDSLVPGSVGEMFELYDYYYSQGNYLFVYFARDRENVYPISCYEGCRILSSQIVIDPDSFVYVGGSYFKDKNGIYSVYGTFKSAQLFFELEAADMPTFEVLEGGYARDKNHVYYHDDIVNAVSPLDFAHLPYPVVDDECPSIFYHDGDDLHLLNETLNDFGIDTFKFFHDYGVFFGNDERVYRLLSHHNRLCDPEGYSILDEANPSDFQAFGVNYYITNGKAYYMDRYGEISEIKGVDIDSFKSLMSSQDNPGDYDLMYYFGSLAKDKNYFYYQEKPLLEIDRDTFHYDESLEKWVDKNGEYYYYDLDDMTGN